MSAPPPAAPPRLRVTGLHAGYGRHEIVHGVDLELPAGSSLCLIGPNGAGKSTLLSAVFGLAEVSAGRVEVDGRDVTGLAPALRLARAGVAYVLQESSVFDDLSVEQNLRLGGYLLRSERDLRRSVERVFDAHPALAARRSARAGVLSGGERRRLEVARALIMQPRLLLIDEPSIGLDPGAAAEVFAMLRRSQAADGLAVLLVEQNARLGLGYAERGCVLVAGKVALQGAGPQLLADPNVQHAFLGA